MQAETLGVSGGDSVMYWRTITGSHWALSAFTITASSDGSLDVIKKQNDCGYEYEMRADSEISLKFSRQQALVKGQSGPSCPNTEFVHVLEY